MKKKFLSILLALTMCLSLLPTMALAAAPAGIALTDAGGMLTESSYYLNGNVTLTNNLTINGDVTLDLNGHVLTGTGSGSVITVNSGKTLTLMDSNPTAEHKFTVNNETGLWTLDEDEGTETVTGGVITGGTGTLYQGAVFGGGVFVAGELSMAGGSIVGNTATNGGGVYVDHNVTFAMTGGNIVGNVAIADFRGMGGDGGGVYVASPGTFTMNGGAITGNTAKNGGGVFVGSSGKFTMSGNSKISGNSSFSGAGVYSGGEFTMSGDSEIAYNRGGCGGGVLVDGSSFTMSGNSTVTYNEGTMWCGGVDVTNGGTFTMSGNSTITYNKGKQWGGGVSLFRDAKFNMTGGSITDNTTPECGGGVYVSGDTDTVTLGGTAQITGNAAKGKANNLYLTSAAKVTLGTDENVPADGMLVGVTLGSTATSTIFTDSDTSAAYFFSDDTDYYVAHNGTSALQLTAVGSNVVQNVTTGTVYADLTTAISAANANDTLKLLDNVTTNETIKIGKPLILTLDLNGKVLKWTGNAEHDVIEVEGGGNLTLTDSNPTATHYFKYSDSSAWTWDDATTTDAITLDAITGSTAENTPIIVTGGCITGGKQIAVKVCGDKTGEGVFTMTGGNIVGNTAADGAGVYLEAKSGSKDEIYPCTFNMTGGRIIGNRAAGISNGFMYFGGMGGGVLMNAAGSKFNMTGGEICRNTAYDNGGGVEVSGGTITLGGTAKITDNLKGTAANNLYLGNNGGQKTVTLGTNGDAPATGFSVGVTLASGTGVFTDVNTKDYSALFTPDAGSDYKVISRADDYKLKLVTKYAVNVADGIQNGTVTTNVTGNKAFEDDTVIVTVTPADGYQLKAGSLKVTKTGGTDAVVVSENTFTMPAYNVTVTAEFELIPAPSGGGSSTPTVTVPVTGESSKVNVQASVSGSAATVKEIKDADLAKVTGGESVEIDLTGLKKNIDTAKIPTTTVEKIAEQSGMSVKLSTATVTFDTAATQEIAAQADGKTIELVVDDIKNVSLNAVQKEAVGKLDTALIIDAYLVSGGERLCSESKGGFGGGKATVILPYEIKNNRTAANYSVFYVDDAGNLERLAAKYDAKLGAFVFDIEHFSNYVVAYDENGGYANCPKDATCVYAKFTDANTAAWYHDGVHYCVENGMMNGVTETEFAPKATLTRGMVVTVLARLDGVTITSTGSEWYADGQKWAVENGVSDGTNMTANITREELATMLYRYALLKKVDVDEITKDTNTLSHNDVFTISDWATSGMHFCIAAGVVNGDDNGNLNPHNTATRAEAAAMFQRFCEKVTK